MVTWLETPRSALWVYGIPGAGMTILSTLVIDEVLNRKRCDSVGAAYFYIRHDDPKSHKVENVLGSLISQLARQQPEALDHVLQLYTDHNHRGTLSTMPTTTELVEQFLSMAECFDEVYILIDGLDKCGPSLGINRKDLIRAISEIAMPSDGSVRTIVYSRDELYIRGQLAAPPFAAISIAARSIDLGLFVNAWIPHLHIQNNELRIDIVENLIEKADGM